MKKIPVHPVEYVRSELKQAYIPTVASETGLSQRWLGYMKNGQIPSPGILMLEKLIRYFGKEITVVKK